MAQRYKALTDIYYISTRTGVEIFVKKGEEFDDMNTVSVRFELEAGNIEEVLSQGGENK